MGQGKVNLSLKFRGFLQVLLISALMIAPAWGQIHKTIHGLKSNIASEQSLFSEHAEGSVICQALDHLGSGDTAQAFEFQLTPIEPETDLKWSSIASRAQTLAHSFSARAPPAFL